MSESAVHGVAPWSVLFGSFCSLNYTANERRKNNVWGTGSGGTARSLCAYIIIFFCTCVFSDEKVFIL